MSWRNVLILIVSLLVISTAALLAFRNLAIFAPPSIQLSSFQTARAEYGTVMTTVEAEGTVVPESEVLLLSPATTIIDRILLAPGSRVNAYQTILRLDPKPLEEDIMRLEDQIEVKQNNLQRTKLNARSTRVDLDYQVEMKKLKIASLKSELADEEELLEVGGISPAKYEQTKQELNLANKELEMIQSKNSIRLRQLQVEERGLELQIEILEKDLESKRQTLSKTSVRAPSAGIIMSIYGKEGEMVSKDKLLIRISDLSSFKINGSVDDDHAGLVKTGHQVFARLENELLVGQIGTVNPEVQGNRIGFEVYLEESNHPGLLSNMNLSLRIVKDISRDVLRLPYGDWSGRGNDIELYVIEGNKVVQRRVEIGLRGPDYIEISSGLREGEEVVISETSAFRNRPEIEISN